MERRSFLKLGSGLLATTALPPTALFAAGESMVFVAWGGTTQEAQYAAWATPLTEATGITVTNDGPTDYGKLRAMVESGNVTWDVVDVEANFAYRLAKEGLLEPIDFSVVNKEGLDERLTFEYGVGSFMSSFVMAWNRDFVSGDPATWADLFDTATFPGKRGFYKWVCFGALEIALLADGVAPDALYPLDLDRAFAKLDTIKSDIIWWDTGAQSQQLLASGEAPIGMFWNGRIYSMIKDGMESLAISWQQHVPGPDMLVVPKGAPNKEAAMKFIAMATSAQGQADFSNASAFAPINSQANALINEDMRPYMPFSHPEQEVPLDIQYWADNIEEIGRRWYAWQAG